MKRLTVAIVSDLQTNSTVGLCPPTINLDDGGTYRSSRGQRWLWHNWCEYIERVQSAKGDGDLYIALDGDLSDGDHHGIGQIISRNRATMRRNAAEVIDPLARLSDKMFFIRGTEAHAGKSAEFEEQLAEDFGAERDGNNWSWWWLVAEWRGKKVDLAHHTSMGSTPAGRGNAANKLAVETIFNYAARHETAPHFVFRAHVHRYADSGENYPTRAVILPCWQFATSYVHKIAAGSLPSVGGMILTIEDGSYHLESVIYPPERTRVWRE